MKVNIVKIQLVLDVILSWATEQTGKYICVSNVHMCMEVFDNVDFLKVVNNADITVPDGKPLVWAQKLTGNKSAEQVRGYDLTMAVCKLASDYNIPVGIFGSTEKVIKQLESNLLSSFERLDIVYSYSPPFRKLSQDENLQIVEDINTSGVKILLVGLGCPKQEIWMAANKKNLSCVMLGVGAAFDFIAGNKRHAPRWMQNIGLEWLFRLLSEPKRLWKRYLRHNPRFVYYFALQLLGKKYP